MGFLKVDTEAGVDGQIGAIAMTDPWVIGYFIDGHLPDFEAVRVASFDDHSRKQHINSGSAGGQCQCNQRRPGTGGNHGGQHDCHRRKTQPEHLAALADHAHAQPVGRVKAIHV
ncbi:hypothetical protein D3C84_930030 [compost metagenome]